MEKKITAGSLLTEIGAAATSENPVEGFARIGEKVRKRMHAALSKKAKEHEDEETVETTAEASS